MLQGSMVALVTPMKVGGELDEEGLRALVEYHIEQGTNAIVAVGTTGESATLDEQEHCKVIRQVVDQVRGRIPVIAGTGSNSTREAIALTRCAQEGGADACLLVTPYYNKPTQEGLYLHHKAVAEAVPLPQILYNVPGRTACDLLPDTVARLAELDTVVAIKEATGDMARAREILERCGDRLVLLSGDDATALDLIALGGKGTISVTANIAPKAMQQMCAAALQGDLATARVLDNKLQILHRDLFVEANPIPVKWALFEMGRISQGIRMPMTPLSESFHGTVRNAMQQAGVL